MLNRTSTPSFWTTLRSTIDVAVPRLRTARRTPENVEKVVLLAFVHVSTRRTEPGGTRSVEVREKRAVRRPVGSCWCRMSWVSEAMMPRAGLLGDAEPDGTGERARTTAEGEYG